MGIALLVVALAAVVPRGDPVDDLKPKLRSSDKWIRRSAVEALATLGTDEAWDLVLAALADPAGEVADTAELVLGEGGEAAAERLLGRDGLRARDAWVRARAAEALGRVAAPVDGDDLADLLSDPEPLVRRAALAALVRRAEEGALAGDPARDVVPRLERALERDRDPRVRARALHALAAFDAERARAAAGDALLAREPELRAVAAALVPRLGLPAGAAARAAEDRARPVRAAAVDALARLATREAALALVAVLEREERPRLVLTTVGHLRALSGRKHRRDPRPWRDWATALPPGPLPPPLATPSDDLERGGAYVQFAGLPILSDRVAFLIDLSGSMWKERADGRTRKEEAGRLLRECLESLPAGTRFNLIPYTGAPIPWRESLAEATPTNVARALAFFEERDERGTGNFWDALLLALADPEVDSVVALGDGVPTGGARHRLELLPALFREENLDRRVALDAVLVDARGFVRRTWEEMAAESGGTVRALEL